MTAHAGRLSPGLAPGVVLGAIALLAASAVSGHGIKVVAPIVISVVTLAAWHRELLQWRSIVGLILLVVLFVPISRYALPGNLPFNLELYRVVVALVVVVWLASLLIDPSVRLRRTYFDGPLLLLVACVVASDLANPGRVNELSDNVAKSLTFFLSFILVYYVVATTLRGREPVMFVLKLIAIGGVVIGLCAIVEQRTGYNAFDHVESVVPFLQRVGPTGEIDRGGNLRVFGPAQHPIALGAALIMILPIAVYFARMGRRRWWVGAVVLVLGALATGSRTAVVMLIAEIIVFLRLKPEETKRLWPALVPGHRRHPRLPPGSDRHLQGRVLPQRRAHRRADTTRRERERGACGRSHPAAEADDQRGESSSPSSAKGSVRALPASTLRSETPRSWTTNG